MNNIKSCLAVTQLLGKQEVLRDGAIVDASNVVVLYFGGDLLFTIFYN